MEGLSAVVLAATELGGMSGDYFEYKTRHLIPIIDKPLIFHLVDELARDNRIKNIYIIIEEKIEGFKRIRPCYRTYNEEIEKLSVRYNKKIQTFGQIFLTKTGTLEAVKSFLEEEEGEHLPILVIYGDSYVRKSYLDKMVEEFYKEMGREEDLSCIFWGITNSDGKGNILINTSNCPDEFRNLNESNILDINEGGIKSINSMMDTGIMIISGAAWKSMLKVIETIHRPSPFGIFSFANILRQVLIFRNIQLYDSNILDIRIRLIPGSDDDYYDANYPWEILKLSDIILKNKLSEIEMRDETAKIIKNSDNLDNYLGKESIKVLEGYKIKSQNKNITIIGPCYLEKGVRIKGNAVIEKSFVGSNTILGEGTNISYSKLLNVVVSKGVSIESSIIRDSDVMENSIIKKSFIGDKCKIMSNVFICNSTLERSIKIHSGSIIKVCIIMQDTNIFHNCLIVRSIIGRNVMLGVGVNIPCKRLGHFKDENLIPNNVVYFSDINIVKVEKFGAVIGDKCQVGSGVIVHPGRRIGIRTIIDAGMQVRKNLPPDSKLVNTRNV